MGLLFNLLRIIENSLEHERDKAYLKAFFRAVHSKLNKPSHSSLFMIFNAFIEPNYTN